MKPFKRHLTTMRSMARVALASCEEAALKVPEAKMDMSLLIKSLKKYNILGKTVNWKCTNTNWSSYEATIICHTWDYSSSRDTFLPWIKNTAAVTNLYNPPEAVTWNISKTYLHDLQAAGLTIIPTLFISLKEWMALGTTYVHDELLSRGWPSVIVKPSVGCDSEGISKFQFSKQRDSSDLMEYIDNMFKWGQDSVLIQPFLSSVFSTAAGEVSLVFIDNEFSHAVRKFPKAGGEYRVQERFGGTCESMQPAPSMLTLGRATISTLSSQFQGSTVHDKLLFARVDMMYVDNQHSHHSCGDGDITTSDKEAAGGYWAVGEVEIIEPFLYLHQAHTATPRTPGSLSASDRLAMAIAERLAEEGARRANCKCDLYAVIRVDTHGNRFVVKDAIRGIDAARGLLAHFDSLSHHQGYYVVGQDDVLRELQRP